MVSGRCSESFLVFMFRLTNQFVHFRLFEKKKKPAAIGGDFSAIGREGPWAPQRPAKPPTTRPQLEVDKQSRYEFPSNFRVFYLYCPETKTSRLSLSMYFSERDLDLDLT